MVDACVCEGWYDGFVDMVCRDGLFLCGDFAMGLWGG